MMTLFEDLPTSSLADVCPRLGLPVRCAPYTIRPLVSGTRIVGRVRPARHCGGIDVFLEALEHASTGEVLVIDNAGRLDEACVGDLIGLEVKFAGLAGMVIWGLHRDTVELREIGLPIFSMGALPIRSQRIEPRNSEALQSAKIGDWVVGTGDFVIGDDDGVLFLPLDRLDEIAALAARICDSERTLARNMRDGVSLRKHVRFSEFLSERSKRPELTYQQHLLRTDKA